MKKKRSLLIFALILALTFTMTGLTACGSKEVSKTIKIATLNGPAGMGVVQMMDQKDKYDITAYESPDEITGKVINGDVDIAAVPSNVAAVLYNKTKGNIVVISPDTLGVLYMVENSTSKISKVFDLKGKTIYASGKGGAPEYILKQVLKASNLKDSDVTVKWLANHADAAASVSKTKGAVAMLPEPFVTVTSSKNKNIKTVIDMNEEWKTATGEDLPMGVLIAPKSFVEDRADDLDILMTDYEASVNFVNDEPAEAAKLIAKWGFIPKAKIAEKAIPNCNIVFYKDADKSKKVLETFYKTLYKLDPKSVGGKLPADDFYR